MLEPRMMEVSLWLFPGAFIAVWVGVPVIVSVYLQHRHGFGPRRQRAWAIAYYIPTTALFAWLLGFGLLESVGIGLVTVPAVFIGAEMVEATTKLDSMEQDSDER
jgi:hypothetical protein